MIHCKEIFGDAGEENLFYKQEENANKARLSLEQLTFTIVVAIEGL